MNMYFISLVKETQPNNYKRTIMGELITNHEFVAHIFDDPEVAQGHQRLLAPEIRGGVVAGYTMNPLTLEIK